MDTIRQPDSGDAAVYTGVLRRRWLIVLAGAVIGLAGAAGYAEVSPKSYTATAEVNVTPTGATAGNPVANSRTSGTTVNPDNEAQLITSATVAAAAKKIMKSAATTNSLIKDVSVTVPPNSSDLDIACAQPTAQAAAKCANAFATAYLRNRNATATALLAAQLHRVQSHVTALEQQASALNNKIKSMKGDSPQKPAALTELRLVGTQLHSLTSQEANLEGVAANVSGGSILTPATPPGKATKPDKTLIVPSGLVAGLLIGLICAFLVDRRDKRVHVAGDIERLLGVGVLADLPGTDHGRTLALAEPRSKSWRAFTALARAVAASLGEGHHVLAVAGTTSGAGGSVVAANLAEALARTHPDVVLVCAGKDDNVAPGMLGVERGPGLTEVLSGRTSVREAVHRAPGVPGLWVITPGDTRGLAGYTLQHDLAKTFVAQLREARYVVIDVESAEDMRDTFALAEFADAALMVVEVPRTTQLDATECLRLLEALRTPVLGAAAIPATSPRATVRPPKPDRARLGSGHDEPGLTGRWLTRQVGVSGDPLVPEQGTRSPEAHGDPLSGFPAR